VALLFLLFVLVSAIGLIVPPQLFRISKKETKK